jgi:hypothetical protein
MYCTTYYGNVLFLNKHRLYTSNGPVWKAEKCSCGIRCADHMSTPSGAVGKDCQRRLLSRSRLARAVAPRIIYKHGEERRAADFYRP